MGTKMNENWDLAVLTAVILILLFFWIYKFLFVKNPIDFAIPISENILSNSSIMSD